MNSPFNINMANIEVPAAFRDMAEKSLDTCRDSFEKLKANADRTNATVGRSLQHASKGIAEYNAKMFDAFHSSMTSNFDFCQSLLHAKGPAEIVEISSAHMRKQYEAATVLAKEVAALAQGVAADSAKAVKGGS